MLCPVEPFLFSAVVCVCVGGACRAEGHRECPQSTVGAPWQRQLSGAASTLSSMVVGPCYVSVVLRCVFVCVGKGGCL